MLLAPLARLPPPRSLRRMVRPASLTPTPAWAAAALLLAFPPTMFPMSATERPAACSCAIVLASSLATPFAEMMVAPSMAAGAGEAAAAVAAAAGAGALVSW